MIVPISYPVTRRSPLYPNTPPYAISPIRSMDRGDSANTSSITLSSHTGTHIDAPSHFCKQGAAITAYLTADTIFFPVHCIDVQKSESSEISVNDLEERIDQVPEAEALLIRTGWHAIRSENPEQYSNDHPWVSPEVPRLLRKRCPQLRLFGIDQISVSSVHHRHEGHECHREFLCGEKPVLLLEDLDLSDSRISGRFRLHVFPFVIESIDGVPVIALAEIDETGMCF